MMRVQPTYSFTRQDAVGQWGAAILDAHFADEYDITHASPEQERAGIDRVFHDVRGRRYTVQYKTDTKAGETGNVYVEVVSGDATGKPGWVYSCTADRLLYYAPDWNIAYMFRPRILRQAVPDWYRRYRLKSTPNIGYRTIGLAVPRAAFAAVGDREFTIDRLLTLPDVDDA